ncbi:MAG TPA: hypothetical protein VK943_06430, partial [Arenibaculum sp.]|nr:hypothetical protein [Arenibaculum sp.]
ESVVLASTAPGLAPGTVVADGAALALPDGATAHFLLATGRTVTVKGPYRGTLPDAETGSGLGLKDLLAFGGVDQATIGGTRAVRDAASRPLTIEADAGATWCVAPGTPVLIARDARPSLRLRPGVGARADDARSVAIDWADGETARPWPASLKIFDGAGVTIDGGAGTAAVALTFRELAPVADDRGAHAVAMVLAGCTSQAERELAALRADVVPLDLYLATDRGRFPTYRSGEPVRLIAQTSRDAWLYCQIRDRRGVLVPIHPPPGGEGRVAGGRMIDLPPGGLSGPGSPAAETAPGDHEVRCFASDQDLSRELPREAVRSGPVPLSRSAAAELDRALDTLPDRRPDTRVVLAQLVIRME